MTWREGNDFKPGFYLGSSVQFGDTFAILGGRDVNGDLEDNVCVYHPGNDTWSQVAELSEPKKFTAALRIDKELVPDC